MGADLVDIQGTQITSNQTQWYKISLADGTEFGLGDNYPSSQNNGRTLVKVVPAGQGMVFRYQRFDGDNRASQGWPQGDKGWLRGIQVKDDGSEVIKNMSLSAGTPVKLCMYDDNNNYGFIAQQLPGNRVALYGYNGNGTLCGLRVTPEGVIVAHNSAHALALDVSFVQVGARFPSLF